MLNSIRKNISLLAHTPKDYLYSFSYSNKDKIQILPFDPKSVDVADEVMKNLKRLCPHIVVLLLGSAGLGIEGRGDIDIYAIAPKELLEFYYRLIAQFYGKPLRVRTDYRDWKFEFKGFQVELFVSHKDNKIYKDQVKLFNLIKNNKEYLNEYRNIKLSMNNHSIKDYVLSRMEFFNRILA